MFSCVFLAALLCASAKPDESCVVPLDAEPVEAWDQSLLALRNSAKTGVFSEEVTEHLAEYHAWSTQHQKALHSVEVSTTSFDQMIRGQIQSSSPCTSALLDVKHEVSSLVHDLKALSEQVGTHVQTLESETGNLNRSVTAFESVQQEYSRGMTECSDKHKQAVHDLSSYKGQLEVLKQVVKPSSPYTHTAEVEWPPVAPHLLEDGVWSKENCLAFVGFTQQHHEHAIQGTDATDCDSGREQLYKACSAMYISVRALAKKAKVQSKDKTCDHSVKRIKNEQLLPLVSQRRQQVAQIKFSTEKLASLQPFLAHLNDRVNTLDTNVVESVHPHCPASEVVILPQTLSHIRTLIHSLQESPSQSDVVDQLPEEEEPSHVAYTVCAGDGDCGSEAPIHLGGFDDATSNISNVAHVQAIMSWGGELV